MYRDPARFPQHARLAALHGEAQAAASFAQWLATQGLHLCTADPGGGYTLAGAEPRHLILQWLGVDPAALDEEGRQIAAEMVAEHERQVRAAAAAPLAASTDN